MICLIDINNFYVSCERIFAPNLEHKPVIVLSNNDGCIISRSVEAKELGIKMGIPYFIIKPLLDKHKVKCFSSNYALYNDISKRTMTLLSNYGTKQEVYSIDECFLELKNIDDLTNYAQKIRQEMKRCLGLPLCVGIGKTKTLAKFANYLAKKYRFLDCVCNLDELGKERTNKAMQITDIKELWGIGRKLSTRLKKMAINTVYDLKIANARQLRKVFNINMEKIISELNGISCINLEEYREPSRVIASTRSFETTISDRDSLLASLTFHAEQVSRKLYNQGLYAKQMVIFANPNRFSKDYYYNSAHINFPVAINSYRYMIKFINQTLHKIFKSNIKYKKSGLIVFDLISNSAKTEDLFGEYNIKKDNLLPTLELIRKQYGHRAIGLGSLKLSNKWQMKQDLMSNKFTTNKEELLTIE